MLPHCSLIHGNRNRPYLSLRTSSGLWIVSNVPLEVIHQIEYSNRFGIDAMARKGAVMFKGTWNHQEFQLAATHLQANSPGEIRRARCTEIADRLLKSVKRKILVSRTFLRNRYHDLSDHYGVEATFEFHTPERHASTIPVATSYS